MASLRTGLLATIAMLAAGCTDKGPPPIRVELSRGDLVSEQSYHGELAPKKTIPVNVPKVPRIDVFTLKTVLPDGTRVKTGDVVATFDTTELEDNLRSAETDRQIAEAERAKVDHALVTEKISLELEQKRRQMAVAEAKLRLVEGVNLISELERKKAEVEMKSAEVELTLATSALAAFAMKRKTSMEVQDIKVKTAEGVVADNRSALDRLAIKAPADGVVFRPYVTLNYTRAKAEPGRVCRAGDKLLELPDLGAFEVVLEVRPRDAVRMQVGDAARVHVVAAGDLVIAGKVARKDSFATTRNERYGTKTPEGNLKEIAVTLELAESPEGLRPGGTVRAELSSVLKQGALLVPLYAMDEEDGRRWVTLASGARREIQIGASSATHAEVVSGLTDGDVLTVQPGGKSEKKP